MSEIDAIFLGIGAYLVATISPGPATLAIMGVAARHGRAAGLKLASGVVCGSLFWGLCAAFGLAAVMAKFAGFFVFLKIGGGLYLLWLAFRALRSALSADAKLNAHQTKPGNYWLQGLAIHLTNPKAVLAWVAILSIGVQQGAPAWHSIAMFGSCALLGIAVFLGYALVFSTGRAQAAYARARRWFELLFGAVFAAAGIMLISERD
ncbi:MAG: LysE family translocator [Rhizobiaceae bacterium]|nr:LysE family translocator [Rhizobiaceae bacterium]